jgi:hypothetical protein
MDSLPCIPPIKNPPFYIAIDYHNVVTLTGEKIREAAKQKYAVSIPVAKTKAKYAIEEGYLRENQFRKLISLVVKSYQGVQETLGALQAISDLRSDGHFVEIVTASSIKALIAIYRWLVSQKVDIPVRALGKRATKEIIASQYDVALDDDIRQAEAYLRGGTTYVFLLNTPMNIDDPTPKGVKRVSDFLTFRDTVRELYKKHYPNYSL